MKVEKLNLLPSFNSPTEKKVYLKFVHAEELNRGDEIIYYTLYIEGINVTERIFQQSKITCSVQNGTHLESVLSNEFAFIPHKNGVLFSKKDFKKHKLNVFFKKGNKITYDSYVGNYFYLNKHLLINKRSVIITSLDTMVNTKIRFDESFDIEWVVLLNNDTIRIIQATSLEVCDYSIKNKKIIKKISLPINKEGFNRLFFRKQIKNITYMEGSIKKDNEYNSELIKLTH